MGIDAAHFRNDEALAVAIGNFANEMTSFYVSQVARPSPPTAQGESGDPTGRRPAADRGQIAVQFSDDAIGEGVGSTTRLALTFGLFFFDADLDGRLDLLQANGHIEDRINEVQASQHYRQPAQLFWNAAAPGRSQRSCYIELPAEIIGDLATPIVGRGAAYADIDGDGDLDVVLTQIAGPPLLLRNELMAAQNADGAASNPSYIRIRLIGDGLTINRDAVGAVIELTAGGITQRRMVMPTRSYLSQVELPVTFGLGAMTFDAIESLRIIWPGGRVQNVPVDQLQPNALTTIRAGTPG
jgi:enediyne biosynthesis protein E4